VAKEHVQHLGGGVQSCQGGGGWSEIGEVIKQRGRGGGQIL